MGDSVPAGRPKLGLPFSHLPSFFHYILFCFSLLLIKLKEWRADSRLALDRVCFLTVYSR